MSTTIAVSPCALSATASALPTRPPPRMMTSAWSMPRSSVWLACCQCARLDGGLSKRDDSRAQTANILRTETMASRAQTPLWRETMKAGAARSGALIGAITIMIGAILMLIALATYHSGDPSLNTASGGPAQNWLGEPGAWLADICFLLFGPAILPVLPISLMIALRLWRDIPVGRWRLMLLASIGGIALIGTTFALISSSAMHRLPAGAGGVVGIAFAD